MENKSYSDGDVKEVDFGATRRKLFPYYMFESMSEGEGIDSDEERSIAAASRDTADPESVEPPKKRLRGESSPLLNDGETTAFSQSRETPGGTRVSDETSKSVNRDKEDEATDADSSVQERDGPRKKVPSTEKRDAEQGTRDSGKESSGKFHCEICGKGFIRRGNLNKHVLAHAEEKKYPCSACDESFKQYQGLKRHMKVYHLDPNQQVFEYRSCDYSLPRGWRHGFPEPEEIKFECDKCPEAFSEEQLLAAHRLTHADEARFPCDQCDRRFKRECDLKKHVKAHSNFLHLICEQCGRTYKTTEGLKKHSVTHEGQDFFDLFAARLNAKMKRSQARRYAKEDRMMFL